MEVVVVLVVVVVVVVVVEIVIVGANFIFKNKKLNFISNIIFPLR